MATDRERLVRRDCGIAVGDGLTVHVMGRDLVERRVAALERGEDELVERPTDAGVDDIVRIRHPEILARPGGRPLRGG